MPNTTPHDRTHEAGYNRDEEQKPGDPPRTAYEPRAAEGSSRNDKTLTDPATGEPQPGTPKPNGADIDAGRQGD